MTNAQLQLLLSAIGAIVQQPTGTIILYGSITPPSGYLPCDGASLLRATYPALFAVIGTSFGAADGTHFNVPDMRSRLPMGVGAGPGLTVRALADQGGAESQVVAQANLAAFALTVNDPGHTHDVRVTTDALATPGTAAVQGNSTTSFTGGVTAAAESAGTGITVASGGSGTALPTVDPFTAVAYFIKT